MWALEMRNVRGGIETDSRGRNRPRRVLDKSRQLERQRQLTEKAGRISATRLLD